MKTSGVIPIKQKSESPKECPIRRFLLTGGAFLIGLLLLAGFAFFAIPASKNLYAVGTVVALIEDSGIEAGAFWYANVEKVSEAERYIKSLDLFYEGQGKSITATSQAKQSKR